MRAVFVILCAALCAAVFPIWAWGDAVVSGGVSPGGRYEVRLWTDPVWDPADFEVRIFDANAGAWILGKGVLQEKDRREDALRGMVALWGPTGDRVTLWDRGGLGLWVLRVNGGRMQEERVPPLPSDWKVDWPLRWEGNRLQVRVEREKPVAGSRQTAERWLCTEDGLRWEKE